MPDPGLMPLPDAAADLDWSNLVDAAKAYEGESTEGLSGPALGRGGAALRCECSGQVSVPLLLRAQRQHTQSLAQPEPS